MTLFYFTKDSRIFGLSGWISAKETNDEIKKYLKRFGFSSSESARESAECIGLTDYNICSMKI